MSDFAWAMLAVIVVVICATAVDIVHDLCQMVNETEDE